MQLSIVERNMLRDFLRQQVSRTVSLARRDKGFLNPFSERQAWTASHYLGQRSFNTAIKPSTGRFSARQDGFLFTQKCRLYLRECWLITIINLMDFGQKSGNVWGIALQ